MGGGIEWGITPNLSIKGEGLYMSFGFLQILTGVRESVRGDRLDMSGMDLLPGSAPIGG